MVHARRRALEVNVETLERLAEDMSHCMHDALRMRCVSEVEHSTIAIELYAPESEILNKSMDTVTGVTL